MADECKFFLGESGQFTLVSSGSLKEEESDIEITGDTLKLNYTEHMEPFITGKKPTEGSVVCYPSVKSESQINTKKEFEDLKSYEETIILPTKTFVESKKESNSYRNRYINVLPYDDNFVKITSTNDSTGYVNASYIPSKEEPLFIATQGPMCSFIEDFWLMVYEHKSTHIVMLGNLVENGRAKVDQYWPLKRYIGYSIELTLLSEEPFSSEVIHRTIALSLKANPADVRTVHQYHYFGWPDHGVPPSADGLLWLVSHINSVKSAAGDKSPIVTHCSAGIGRTGAYCAIDIAIRSIREQRMRGITGEKLYFDMMYITKMLRNSRKGMIQQLDQYKYCYQAVLRYIEVCAAQQNFEFPEPKGDALR